MYTPYYTTYEDMVDSAYTKRMQTKKLVDDVRLERAKLKRKMMIEADKKLAAQSQNKQALAI